MRHFQLVTIAALNLAILSACGDMPAPGQEQLGSISHALTTSDPLSKGYRLFWDGKLVGQVPTWTRSQGVSNCQWNIQQYPQKKVECDFDGVRLGYELFWDGNRVGYEPGWTRSQGVSNCDWNDKRYPQKKVECDFDGVRLGYELFWDNNRVGYEPGWSESRSIRNCAWNRQTYERPQPPISRKRVQCRYDGAPVLAPIPASTCGGVPTYVVRTENGECHSVAGWSACPLDPEASSASRLCVYQFSSGQPSSTNLSDLTAIAANRWNPNGDTRRQDVVMPHALGACGSNRPDCSASQPLPATSAVPCDPNTSQECCEGLGRTWGLLPNGEVGCGTPYEGVAGCDVCGFGFVENGVLTVVLDPRDADESTYYAQMATDDGFRTMALSRPQGGPTFTVSVGARVFDQSVDIR